MAQKNETQLTITATDATRQAFESVKRSLEGLNKTAELAGKALGLAFVGHEVKDFIADIVNAGIAFERSQNLMQATLKATGYAAGLTAGDLEGMVKALSEKTVFDDAGLRQAETALLRFKNLSGETFNEALKLTADYASASGKDLTAAAETIGRASQGQERDLRALAEVMPHLTNQQKDMLRNMIDAGRGAEATRLIFDQLKGTIGGAAEAENQGLYGSLHQTKKAWDEFLVSVSQSPAVNAAAQESLGYLSKAFKELDEDIERIKKAKGIGGTIGEIAAALDPRRAFGIQNRPKDVVETTDPVQMAKQRADRERAEAGKAEQKRVADQNKAYDAEQRRIQARVALTRAAAETQAADQTQFASQAQDVLEHAYAKGLITTSAYYDALLIIDKSGLQKRLDAIKGERDAQAALLAAPSTKIEQKPAIRATMEKLDSDAARIRRDILFADSKAAGKRDDDEQKYKDTLTEVNAELLEQKGLLADAAKKREEIQNRAATEALKRGGGAGLVDLKNLEQGRLQQHQLAEATRDTSIAQQELANRERDIASAVESGSITQTESLAKLDAARKEGVKTLTEYADAQERLAKTPEEVQAVRNLRSEIKALGASANQSTKQMQDVLESGLNQPLLDFIKHTQTAGEAFRSFANNVAGSLQQIAIKNLSESVFGGGASGGSGLGVAGKAAPFLASLFGGGGGAATATSATATTSAVTSAGQVVTLFGSGGIMTPRGMLPLHRYASGGLANSPQVALFGEGRQNEAYVPLPDGRRIPVAMRGGGGTTQHVTINIQTPDVASFRRSESQVATSLAMAGRRALARR